jgi:PAS domain S-box-containing protein
MRVLLVEDSDADAGALQSLLYEYGFTVTRVARLSNAIATLRSQHIDVILLDLGLPDSKGTKTLERTLDATRSIPVVVLTGCADEDVAVDAVAAGAQDYLMKGATDGRTLFRALRYACERHRAEERIRVSEERYRALVENSADGIALLDRRGTILYTSPAVTRILGWSVEEFEGQDVFRFVHEDDRTDARASHAAVVAGELRRQSAVRRYLCRDGSWRHLEVTRANRLDDPAVGAIVVNYRDVTERIHADELLDALRRRYELIVNSIADGVHGIDRDGNILFENPASVSLLGWGPGVLVGRSAHDIVHHSTRDGRPMERHECAIEATLEDGQVRHLPEEVFWRKDGSMMLVEYTVAPMLDGNGDIVGAAVTFRDISRERYLEEQVEQGRRVASLGRVTASVAHEFNNVLMGIQPFAELIRRDAAPESRTSRAAEKILGAAKRAARLTTQLLRYTQPAEPAMDTIDLGHWVNEFRDEAQNLLWDRTLAVSTEPSLLVRADSMQLQQIIANLVLNARDATIPGDVVTLGVARAHDIPFVAKKLANGTGFVTLFVQDSGKGIAPSDMDRIFEPMFTTKRKGTGLGLAVAQQIVTQHGGKILVDTTEGEGATFHIVLPRV